MDADTNNLVAQLCTRAGMMMQDLSRRALALGGKPREASREILEELLSEVTAIRDTLKAARAILRDSMHRD